MFKKILYTLGLIAVLIPTFALALPTQWDRFIVGGIRPLVPGDHVLIGGSSTTTNANLEVQGSAAIASSTIGCVQAGLGGILFFTGSACGSGGSNSFAFPFTVNTGYNSTTTVIGFLTGGLFSTASSTFSGPLRFTGLSQGGLYVGSTGLVNTVATSTITASTGLSYSGTMGSMLGGSSGNLTVNTSQNISTLSNLTTNGFVTTTGGTGALSVTTLPIGYSSGGTGTTTAPQGQLLYGGATSYQSVATTSVTCSGSASCSSFTVIGNSPVTISATGGGSGTVSSGLAGQLGFYNTTGTTIQGTSTAPLYVGAIVATTTSLNSAFLGNVGIGTRSPGSNLVISGSSAYAQIVNTNTAGTGLLNFDETDNGFTHDFFIKKYGSTNATPGIVQLWNVDNAAMDFGINNQRALHLYNTNPANSLLQVESPSGGNEADLIARVISSAGNYNTVELDTENYAVDNLASIIVSKTGTGKVVPFGIRFWNQDSGSVDKFGLFNYLTDPSGATAIGSFATTTGVSTAAYDKTIVLQIASTTAPTLLQVGTTTPWFTVKGTGNVGVGSTTPYGKFSIDAPAQTNPLFVIGSSTSQVFSISPADTTFGGQGSFSKGSTTPWGYFSINPNGIGTNPSFVIGSSTGTQVSVASGGYGTTTLSGLNVSGSATSTANVGFNLTTGCYAINGGCIGSGSFSNTIAFGGTGSTQFANNSIVTSNANGTALIATGTQLTIGNLLATTTATSTFTGPLLVKGRQFIVGSGATVPYVPTGGGDPSYSMINRSSAIQDASLLFYTNGSCNWEIGLPGDSDLHIKSCIGADGSSVFTDRQFISSTTGAIGFGTTQPTGFAEFSTSTTASIGNQITITNRSASGSNRSAVVLNASTPNKQLYFATDAGSNGGQNGFINWGSFGTGFYIDSSGNIGVQNAATNITGMQLTVGSSNNGKMAISTSTGGCSAFSGTGELYSTGTACGSGVANSFGFPFTMATHWQQTTAGTTTALWLQGTPFSLFASSTSVFDNASTTFLTVSGTSYFPSLSQGNVYIGSGNILQTSATSTPTVTSPIGYTGTLGQFIGGVSGAFTCTTCITSATVFSPNSVITSNSSGNLIATGTQLTVGNILATTTANNSFLGNILAPVGAVGTPSFSFNGNANTGIYQGNGANTIDFSTNGVWRMGITSAGIVGINSVNPTEVNANSRLTVASTGSTDIVASTTDNTTLSDAIFNVYAPGARAFLGAHGTNQVAVRSGLTLGGWAELGAFNSSFGSVNGLLIDSNQNVPIVFGTNNAERLRIEGLGYLDIATTTNTAISSVTISSSTAPQISLSAGAGLAQTVFRNDGNNFYIATSTVAGTATTSISALEIALGGFGTTTLRGLRITGLATSTSNVGFNITTGCYAVNGTCVSGSGGGGSGTVTSVIAGAGFQNQGLNITSSGTLVGAIATSATPVVNPAGLAYWTLAGDASNPAKLGTVATSTATCSSGITCNTFTVVGSTNPSFTLTAPVTVALGGTNSTSFIGNSIITSNSAGTSLVATTTQPLYVGSLTATSSLLTSTFLSNQMLFGTTTGAQYPFVIASSTQPQLVLSAGAGLAQWTMRNAGGTFYLGTTTVVGTATTSTAALTLTANGKPGMGISSSSPTATLTVETRAGDFNNSFFVGSSTELFRIDNSGKVYANNTSSSGSSQTGYWCYDASGQFIRDTAVCLVSAKKFKQDIHPLEIGLDSLMKLTPVTYYKKDPMGAEDSHQQMGFIADDVATQSPELNEMLVTYVGGGTSGEVHAFRYDQFTALLTKSIQDLNNKVDNMKGVTRKAEENWQWLAMGILAIWNLSLTFRKKREN